MTAHEFQKAFEERVAPVLGEMGVIGFAVAGYVEDGEGRTGRFALAHTNGNPIVEDAMSPLIRFTRVWSAPAREFCPPGEGASSASSE